MVGAAIVPGGRDSRMNETDLDFPSAAGGRSAAAGARHSFVGGMTPVPAELGGGGAAVSSPLRKNAGAPP